ncbi:MAG: rhodanese-like domain-containing protein [Bacteroidota bacterium]
MSLLARFFKRPASHTLTPAAFLAQRASGDLVLDVRTPAECALGCLEGSLNVDALAPHFQQRLEALIDDGTLAPERPVYLYCGSGHRSGKATQRLRALGFEQAYNIGGYSALKAAGAV